MAIDEEISMQVSDTSRFYFPTVSSKFFICFCFHFVHRFSVYGKLIVKTSTKPLAFRVKDLLAA